MPIINTPPRSVIQTRRMKSEFVTKLVENDGDILPKQTQSLPPEDNAPVTAKDAVESRPRSHAAGSNKSVTSSVFMARKMQLELEAAVSKAKIDKELIDKKLALEIAALEVQSNRSDRSHRSSSTGQQKVEEWLDRSDREMEQKHKITGHVDVEPPAGHGGNSPAACRGGDPPPACRGGNPPPATAVSQPARDQTDIEKLADALQNAISASTSKVQSPELLSRLVTSKDLPMYFGDPMEWIQFKDAYGETTTRCKFSDSENIDRLRKCLRGDAKEAVVAMLSGKTDPNIIMQTLELRFGHPEVIINKIVIQIKRLQPLSQAYHNEIAIFATKVKNFAVTARSINQADYLRSPELINTVLTKFPSSLINRWTDYAYEHLNEREKSKFEHLSDFLVNEANKAASAGVSHINSQADKNRKQHEERRGPQYPVLLTSGSEICNFCRTANHRLPECPRFKRAMRRDRWRYVRFNKLCFKCLMSRHDKQMCPATACNVDNCGQDHHKLLHWIPKKDTSFSDNCAHVIDSDMNAETSVNTTTNFDANVNDSEIPDLSDYVNNTNFRDNKVLLKVVSVIIHGPSGSKQAYALLDDAASISLVSADLANSVGLSGRSETLHVRGAWNNTELSCTSEIVNFTITNTTGESYNVRARKMCDLNLPVQKLSTVNFDKYEHLKDFKTYVLRDDVKPQMLIGQDHYHLLVPLVTVSGSYNKPYVTRTPLGFCVHGVCSSRDGRYQNDAAPLATLAQHPDNSAPARPAPPAAPTASSVLSHSPYLQLPRETTSSMDYSRNDICNSNLNPETVAFVHSVNNFELQEENEGLRNLSMMVRNSFALEAIGVTTKPRQSKDELRAISILEDTAKLINGQWEVGLPWKSNASLPDSYPNALNRLLSLEKKFKKDDSYASRYRERINHLFTNSYAREVVTNETAERVWNLPHFGIDNPNKRKLRVVFDSAATSGGQSLNDYLLQGPDILQSLLGIMFRFREGPIAWVGDLKDMFLRIKIRKEDQSALRFLWRDSAGEPVKTFAMTALLFGANCSPFVAQYVKNKNAQRFEAEMPEAVNAIIKSHYMDDYLDSHDNEQKAMAILNDVLKIHKYGGFEMRNIMCNKPDILCTMPEETLSPSAIKFKVGNEDFFERTLGLLWSPISDSLGFDLSLRRIPEEILTCKQIPTKREVLRIVMSIFDVYGLLAPFTIKGRIIIQNTWKLNIGWNDKLPDQLFAIFREWITQLQTVKDLKIPRWYFSSSINAKTLELHIFCDASPSAFACVAYWRVIDNTSDNHSVQTSFIASKCRVTPVKPVVSVPRLELQAAVLGCRLANTIENEHRIKPAARFFWTDSTTVLYWIKNENRNYKVFIANRLGEIDSLSKITEWRYVATDKNIADAATKTNSYKLEANCEWLHGPAFLHSRSDEWPAAPEKENIVNESLLEKVLTTTQDTYSDDLPVPDPERFSSWCRLLGAMSAVLRFVSKCRKLPEKTPYEIMKLAEPLVIRKAQRDSFGKDLSAIESGKKHRTKQ